jgi:hypothetical protein
MMLLIPLVLSSMPMNTGYATMTGTVSKQWTETGSSELGNGTTLYYGKDAFVYHGVFSGSSTGNDTFNTSPNILGGTFRAVEYFTGSFNASQQGGLTFRDEGSEGSIDMGGWLDNFIQ